MNVANIIEGLRVVVQRRGCAIQQGDVMACERAIEALLEARFYCSDCDEYVNGACDINGCPRV